MSQSSRHSTVTFDRPGLLWAIRGTALVGLAISLYLAASSLQHTPLAGCGDGALLDCEHVLGTAWSRWLGLPVAVLGAGLYALISLLTWLTPRRRTVGGLHVWMLLWLFCSLAAGAGIWFAGLQLFAVGKLCLYCLAVHTCGLALAVMTGWQAWRGCERAPKKRKRLRSKASPPLRIGTTASRTGLTAGPDSRGLWVATALAGCGVASLAGGQYFWPAATYQILESDDFAEPIALIRELTEPPTAEPMPTDSAPTQDAAVEPATFTTQSGGARAADGPPAEASSPGDSATKPTDTRQSVADQEAKPAEQDALKPPRRVIMLKGRLTVMPSREPMIGSAEAPHVFLEIVDYTCKHCHLMHRYLRDAHKRYGDQFSVIVFPVPMDAECNSTVKKTKEIHKNACKYARLALAVWSIDRDAFAELHDWMMGSTEIVPLEAAIERAYQLVDREALKTAIASAETEEQIQGYVRVFQKMVRGASESSKRSLPIVILEDTSLMGAPESAEALYKIIEEHVGLRPQPTIADER